MTSGEIVTTPRFARAPPPTAAAAFLSWRANIFMIWLFFAANFNVFDSLFVLCFLLQGLRLDFDVLLPLDSTHCVALDVFLVDPIGQHSMLDVLPSMCYCYNLLLVICMILNVVVLSQIFLLTVFQKLAPLGARPCTLYGIFTLPSMFISIHENLMQIDSIVWLSSMMQSWFHFFSVKMQMKHCISENSSAQNRSLSAPVLSTH